MNQEIKVTAVMNLMYHLLLAVVLSAAAELINTGEITWPSLAIDSLISYILEMLIAMLLPFSHWGMKAAFACAPPGSVKFRLISSSMTALPFATLMSLAMSFIGTVVMAHLPMIACIVGFLRV